MKIQLRNTIFLILIFIVNSLFARGLNEKLFDNINQIYSQEYYDSIDSITFIGKIEEWAWERNVIINYEQAPGDYQKNKYKIGDLTGHEVLKMFCKNNRYVLRQDRNIINIIPEKLFNDKSYIMNAKIPYLKANKENRFQIFDKIISELKRLYPGKYDFGQKGEYEVDYLLTTGEIHFSNSLITTKKPVISFIIRNSTVRDILNKISEEENAYWVVRYIDKEYPVLTVDFSLEDNFMFYGNQENKNKKHHWYKHECKDKR